MTPTVVTRRSTSGEYISVSVLVSVTGTGSSGSDSLEAQTVSLVLLTSSISLLSGSKNFFYPNDSSYLYLLPSLTGKFVNILFGIVQHRLTLKLN